MDELRTKLNKAELQLSDATETASNCQEKEAALKSRTDKLTQELDRLRIENRRKLSTLQVCQLWNVSCAFLKNYFGFQTSQACVPGSPVECHLNCTR